MLPLQLRLSSCGYTTNSLKKTLQKDTREIETWWSSPRFKDIKRTYSAEDVAKHRGTLPVTQCKFPSSIQAQKLFSEVEDRFQKKVPLHTLGVIDPVQMSQLARCNDIGATYISGWACSSTMVGSTNEVSPDFGDYPYDTVPRQVERIFKAQQLHDRKAKLAALDGKNDGEYVDYLKPIIADADMGHGGPSTVMKLAKLFVEKGAAAIHLEDQLVGGKRCGHLGGAVLVPTSTHLTRLLATRFQWDVMGAENLIIARTDSCNSKLLSSSSDPRDHKYIKGIITPYTVPWSEEVTALETQKAPQRQIGDAEQEWYTKNTLYTVDEAVKLQMNSADFAKYVNLTQKVMKDLKRNYLSIRERLQISQQVNPTNNVIFDYESPRTKEGYYMFNGCMDAAIERTKLFAPFADMLWLETKTPNLDQAKSFAQEIHKDWPNSKLVYNLSPSFNWSEHGFTNETLQSFIWDLAKEGFILQLVSLAGLHVDGISFWELAKMFETQGMKAYIDLVQQKEKDLKCDLLTHQKWSGAEFIDSMLQVIQNGSSSQTLSTSGDSYTENQFH
ncbi:mitochondrial 2-methylisocitrate lyase Icl2p [Monosporozyma unispora]|nr:mitochondrial 2-methylisocitrate lyase [Kazachstania unispora]